MSKIAALLNPLQKREDCVILPATGLPPVKAGHVLPEDLTEFYSLCGGGILFRNSDFPITLVDPDEFTSANRTILAGFSEEALAAAESEISGSWYVIAHYDSTEYICIDCSPLRAGRCYHSLWDSHAMEGHSPIIALSFFDFLTRYIDNQGNGRYWEQRGAPDLGDAYDTFLHTS